MTIHMIISELFDSFMTKQKIHGKVKLTENTQFGFEYYDTMSSSHSANRPNRPLIMSYEELITCPICLEYFTKPRYLPCLHTYCEDCLSDYISTAYNRMRKDFHVQRVVCSIVFRLMKINPQNWRQRVFRLTI